MAVVPSLVLIASRDWGVPVTAAQAGRGGARVESGHTRMPAEWQHAYARGEGGESMPTETLTRGEQSASEPVPRSLELEAEEELRAEATEQIRRERRFKMHAIVIAFVTLLVGVSWVLTEYYTAHSSHTWPSSFADAPADRPGVWSTWFFYFAGAMLLVIAIDAYRTYAKPYIGRSPTRAEVDRQVERLKAHR
jgi:hypothetical protein